MRTSFLTIGGKEHMLCMSNRVLVDLESKGKSLETFLTEGDKTITNICWLVRRMSEAGRAYAKVAGLGDYPAITEDEILDVSGSDDYDAYMEAVIKAAGGDRKVDAEPPKNAEAASVAAQDG